MNEGWALILDCETLGLPGRYDAPERDVVNWPRAIQVAWAVCTGVGKVRAKESFIIALDGDGLEIPDTVQELTGITPARVRAEGVPLRAVLIALLLDLQWVEYVVAHNFAFDASVLGAEFWRLGWGFNPLRRARLTQICTMQRTTEFCRLAPKKLRADGSYKWPRLEELYKHLFGKVPEIQHDAGADVEATRRCYYELRRLRWPLTDQEVAEQLDEE